MIHRLEIENFYSICDPQVIDLRATGHVCDDDGRLAPIFPGSAERAPKVVALFGANASGKSNVLKALSAIAWFMTDSFSAPRGRRMPFGPFNDIATLEAPTRLAVHLTGPEDIGRAGEPDARRCPYIYYMTVVGSERSRIVGERLFYRPSTSKRILKLFERDANGDVTATPAFGLSGFRQALDKILRPDASVIATLAQLEHPYSMRLWETANQITGNILVERVDRSDEDVAGYYADRPHLVDAFNRDIARIDLGIQSIQFFRGPHDAWLEATHRGLSLPMPILYESHGTRQFIKLYPLLLEALESGGIAVIDELDAAIHPLILPEILRWFRDPVRNPHDAQLWMTCHNASLLEDLSKEEVLFCDKDDRGRTDIYRLSDIQSVRRGDNFYRKYLGGAFGAVPQIG